MNGSLNSETWWLTLVPLLELLLVEMRALLKLGKFLLRQLRLTIQMCQ